MKNEKKQWGSLLFLGFVLILYLILFFVSSDKTVNALKASGDIFIKLIPALLVVIFLMGFLNFFLKPKSVSKYLGEDSGYKG